ncbi:RmlC-like cupin domain-containing protein [Geopyxis carbonaria]|nr:RmlC-like cupin domain-containing protein [Geopyxis carbonaria]
MATRTALCFVQLLALCQFLPGVFAAPAGSAQPTPTGTFATTGTLRGPTSLRGLDPNEPQVTEDTTVPTSLLELAPGQADDTIGAILDFSALETPQPIRGSKGGSDPGPRDVEMDRSHPDIFAPPGTDHGTVPQLNWPMGLSHNKLGKGRGGWSRQQNLAVMPAATQFAGVDMRLEAGAYREMHWHTANEWALVLNGSARVQAMNEAGQTMIDDLQKGDVWFFPSGIPHYLQGLENGTEFLLIFDDGEFSEDETFLVTEMFAGNPLEVWAKNLDLPTDAFKDIPDGELFIFNGTLPPKDIEEQNVTGAAGVIPNEFTYSYHWSQQVAEEVPGGSVKILDNQTFPIASDFSAALVTIKPGAIREVHWHPQSDEWNFFIQGEARMTVYVAPSSARTFDYRKGDVGYVPKSSSHYVENRGTDDVIFLEVLKQGTFTDISVGKWLALTPPQVLKDHLHLSDETIAHLSKEEPLIVQGQLPEFDHSTSKAAKAAATAAPEHAKAAHSAGN